MASHKPPHQHSGVTRKVKAHVLSSWVSSILSGSAPPPGERLVGSSHFPGLGTPSMFMAGPRQPRRAPAAPSSWTARSVGSTPAWRAQPSSHSRTDRAARLARVGSLIQQSRNAPVANAANQSGVALMELMLVVGTIMVVSGGVFAVYRVAEQNERVARETQNAEYIAQNLTTIMASSSNFEMLTDTAKAVELGIIPDRMIDGTGAASSWGGAVTVAPYTIGGATGRGVLLTYEAVPASACSRFIANIGPGFHTIEINDEVLSQNFSALSPSAIANLCSTQSSNKIDLVYVKDGGTGLAAAPLVSCVAPPPETQTITTCPPNQAGTTVQERGFVCDSPYGVALPTAWTNVSSTCTPICTAPPPAVSTATENQNGTCLAGRVTPAGANTFPQTRTRTSTVNYTCPPLGGSATADPVVNTYTPWSPAETSSCAPACTTPPSTNAAITRSATKETQTIACPSGQLGSTTQERDRVENGTRTTAWTCPAPTGSATSSTSDTWSGTYTATSSWTTVSSTCAPQCVAPPPSVTTSAPQSASCASGRLTPQGASTFSQTRSVTVSYSCPAPTGAYVTNPATYGTWTPTESEACAPTCTAPAPGTVSQNQTATCPAGTYVTGQTTAVTSFSQTRSAPVSYSCPQPVGSSSQSVGTWSPWSPSVDTACASRCTAPATSITYTTQSQTASCPSGSLTSGGSSSFTQTRTRTNTVTYSCPSYTGPATANPVSYTFSPYSPTAAEVCFSACSAPPPATETAAAPPEYRTLYCPAGQYGQLNQSRWVTHSRTTTYSCPAPTGSFTSSTTPWGAPYNYGTFTTNSGTCTNCPPTANTFEYRWAAKSAQCPAGQYGTHTWEQQQYQARSVTYTCPAGTTSLPPATFGPPQGWYDMSSTRSVSNTCTNCPPSRTDAKYQYGSPFTVYSCPAGQYGQHNYDNYQVSYQNVSYSCPAGTTTMPVGTFSPWSAWQNTGTHRYLGGSCTNCPPSRTDSRTQYAEPFIAYNCPAGYYGHNNYDNLQVSYQNVSYNCPAGTATMPVGTFAPWSAWQNTGTHRYTGSSCVGCPAPVQNTHYEWAYRPGPACPNPYWTGVNGWNEIRAVTYYTNYNCPAGTASLPTPYNDRWGAWYWTGNRSGQTSCALPACGTTLETQAKYYMAAYQDLYNAFAGNWQAARNHWSSNGYYEGRTSCWPAPAPPPPPPPPWNPPTCSFPPCQIQ